MCKMGKKGSLYIRMYNSKLKILMINNFQKDGNFSTALTLGCKAFHAGTFVVENYLVMNFSLHSVEHAGNTCSRTHRQDIPIDVQM